MSVRRPRAKPALAKPPTDTTMTPILIVLGVTPTSVARKDGEASAPSAPWPPDAGDTAGTEGSVAVLPTGAAGWTEASTPRGAGGPPAPAASGAIASVPVGASATTRPGCRGAGASAATSATTPHNASSAAATRRAD